MRSNSHSPIYLTFAGIILILLLLAGFYSWKTAPKTFSCSQNGQTAILASNVLTFSCTNPRFIISCDERTLAFYSTVFTCSSFDSTKYKFIGKYEQVGTKK